MQHDVDMLRREFIARLIHGERLDVDDFLAGRSGLDVNVREVLVAAAKQRGLDVDAHGGASERIGPFRLVRHIGGGAQAIVWLAEDTRFAAGRRLVALKVFVASQGANPGGAVPDALRRARREAAVLARLDDDAIATMLDAGADATRSWIAMRYVDGESLAQRIAAGDLTLRDPAIAVPLVERLARALHVAHEAGILHRDVKPSNVVVRRDGRPVLVDFGLARDQDADRSMLTLVGETPGTLAYVAPEALGAARATPDRRGDVYALGVTLYECLAGRRAFAADHPTDVATAVVRGTWTRLERLRGDLPRDLAIVVATAMEIDPSRRYTTADAFADDLRRVLLGQPILARPPSRLLRAARTLGPHKTWIVAGLAGIVVYLAFWMLSARFESRRLGARLLAASSKRLAEGDATLALLLAVEGAQRSEVLLADEVVSALDALVEVRSVAAHAARVRACEPIPGTRRFVTCGDDGAIRIFDADSLSLVRELRRGGSMITTLSISPDGRFVSAGGSAAETEIWSVDAELSPLRFPSPPNRAASFSENGDRCLVIDVAGKLSLRSLPAGTESCSFPADGLVHFASLSRDGLRVVANDDGGPLHVYDCSGSAAVETMTLAGAYTASQFVARGHRILASRRAATPLLVDPSDGSVMSIDAIADASSAIAESPDGKHLFLASTNQTAVVVESLTGTVSGRFAVRDRSLGKCIFAADGDVLFCSDRAGRAIVFDAVTGDIVQSFAGHADTSIPAFVSAIDRFGITADATGRIRRFAFDDRRTLQGVVSDHAPWIAVAVDAQGRGIAIGGLDRRLRILHPSSGRSLDVPPPDGWPSVSSVAFAPRGDMLAIAVANQPMTRLLDANDGRTIRDFENVQPIAGARYGPVNMGLAFDPQGKRLATVAGDGATRIFDVDSGAQLHVAIDPSLEPHSLGSIAFSADGRRVVITSAVRTDGRVFVFDADTGRETIRIRAHGTWMPESAQFATQGDRIVVACEDGAIREFDAREGTSMRDVDGRDGALRVLRVPIGFGSVTSLAQCANGRLLVAGTRSGHVAYFDVTTGALLARTEIAGRSVRVASSTNGESEYLVAASEDGHVRWLDADPLATAASLAPRRLLDDERRMLGLPAPSD